MNIEIAEQRLENQRITRVAPRGPADVVSWLGAIQAQEYDAAKWAIGLRMSIQRGAETVSHVVRRSFISTMTDCGGKM